MFGFSLSTLSTLLFTGESLPKFEGDKKEFLELANIQAISKK